MKLVDYVPSYRSEAGTGVGMAFAVWHGYLETGIQQIKAYADKMTELKRKSEEWEKVPVDQQEEILKEILRLTKIKMNVNRLLGRIVVK